MHKKHTFSTNMCLNYTIFDIKRQVQKGIAFWTGTILAEQKSKAHLYYLHISTLWLIIQSLIREVGLLKLQVDNNNSLLMGGVS